VNNNLDLYTYYAIPHAPAAFMAKKIEEAKTLVTTLHGTDITLVGKDKTFAR
jgi:hypothetical protein